MNSLPPVAVIGAGMAGLACAQLLAEAGCRVDIFEKSRGPSGRMSTRRAQDLQCAWQCDHGAPSFAAQDPEFVQEVRQWEQHGVVAAWRPRAVRLQGTDAVPAEAGLDRWVGVPRMTSPAAFLVQRLGQQGHGVRLHLQATVQHLQHGPARWTVHCAEQGQMGPEYCALVLAVPAPQAAALLEPVSPYAAALAASARMQPCWVAMLRTDAPLPLDWDAAEITDGPLCWVARDSAKPGRQGQQGQQTWVLHASARWSQDHIESDAESVARQLLQAFEALAGSLPGGLRVTAHRWRYALPAPHLVNRCWWDAPAGLGLCGDWMCGAGVEGAWLSGRALARRALATLTR
ncbi:MULTISPECIES: NAD(P)/FAD-dependent oxidoreductase [Delftia]|uniref:NAD(P)/FAD-dependent oxidoreductase n=1 Tax=Delftia TaxID=80865 RepID=UPI00064074B0|nr:FAD-dependent oxidoreductase [Delftia lacustris]